MGTTVEFWFDFSCPYAYLASRVIEDTCAAAGADLVLAPMLLGGVFRAIGAGDGPMATLSAAKAGSNARDMARWAERRGVPLQIPPAHPMRTVRALRTFLGLPAADWPRAMHAIYAAYWQRGADVTDDALVASALREAGLSDDAIARAQAGADDDAIKDELRRRTDAAVAHGIFGAPAMVVQRDGAAPILLWGQDRVHWLAAVLAGWDPDGGAPPVRPSADGTTLPAPLATPPTLDFWFDFSSPFAYLGSTQIEAVAAAAGAVVRYRPLLLGALFKDLGTVDVPLFKMPQAKQRYVGLELARWARWYGVDFRFTSRFPMRTVTALRLVLLAGDRAPALIARLFRALWVEDRDLASDVELRAQLAAVGLDPALIDRTSEPAVKQALVDSTAAARGAGVFGVPTAIVDGRFAFWGQDRLDLLAAALRGWQPVAG